MPILFLGILVSSLTSFYGALYIALEKTKEVGISSFIGAILNIGINVVLISKIGLYAASISTFVSFLIILFYRIKKLDCYFKMTYYKKDICIGILLTFLTISCFYIDYFLMYSIAFIFTVLYNIKYNCIIKYGIHKLTDLKKQNQ